MTPQTKREALYVGGGLVVAVVLLHLASGAQAPKRGARGGKPTTTRTPNPANSALEQAFFQARTQALTAYDQSVLGEQSLQEQQAVAFNTNAATTQQTRITSNAQVRETQLQTATEQAVAQAEASAQEQAAQYAAQAQEQAAQAQANAQNTSSNDNLFSSIFGGIMNFLPFIPGI